MEVSLHGWFTKENPIKMDDRGVPLCQESSIGQLLKWNRQAAVYYSDHGHVARRVARGPQTQRTLGGTMAIAGDLDVEAALGYKPLVSLHGSRFS